MSVIFKAHIKENQIGGWCIDLSNTQTNEAVICNNLDDFSTQIELLGAPYKGDIEVQWSKADNLTPEHFFEVKEQMARMSKELRQDD